MVLECFRPLTSRAAHPFFKWRHVDPTTSSVLVPRDSTRWPLLNGRSPARPWNWPDGRNSWTLCIWTRRWTLNKVPFWVFFQVPSGFFRVIRVSQGRVLIGKFRRTSFAWKNRRMRTTLCRECHPQTSEVRFLDVCFCIFGNYATWYA